MDHYKNLSGKSGISSYELRVDSILVQFSSGKSYVYSYSSAGAANVEQLKRLAVAGSGLNSFIMKNVSKLYVR